MRTQFGEASSTEPSAPPAERLRSFLLARQDSFVHRSHGDSAERLEPCSSLFSVILSFLGDVSRPILFTLFLTPGPPRVHELERVLKAGQSNPHPTATMLPPGSFV